MKILCAITAVLVAASNLPLPAYQLTSKTIHERPNLTRGYFSEKDGYDPEQHPDWGPPSYTQYYLDLTEPHTRVELGKEVPGADPVSDPLRGMNPDTLALEWVLPARLLTVRWTTHGIANGNWTVEGFVVLEKTPQGWREVFRDYHDDHYSGGAMSKTNTSLSLTPGNDGECLALTLINGSYYGDAPEWEPLARYDGEVNGSPRYSSTVSIRTQWQCRVADGTLTCSDGKKYIELGEDTFPIDNVARQLLHMGEVKTDEQRARVLAEVARLRELNPSLADQSWATGDVSIDIVPPYEPQPEHTWGATRG